MEVQQFFSYISFISLSEKLKRDTVFFGSKLNEDLVCIVLTKMIALALNNAPMRL